MNITTLRLYYARSLVALFIIIFLFVASQSLAGGTAQFENNLWGREFLITAFTRLRLKLGDRVFSQALVGKDGWLDFTGTGNLDGYQNPVKTRPASLKNTAQLLNRLYDALRKKNITLLLVIPPNKATIYPDKLPDEIQKINPNSQLDDLAAYLNKNGPPVLVDLRPALQEGRKKQDVYYKTNTHWNGYGIFISYREIIKTLSKTYPALSPNTINDFRVGMTEPFLHDLPRIMGASYWLEPGTHFSLKKNNVRWVTLNDDRPASMQISTTPQDNLPTLLMYTDSFGAGLEEFLAPHFRKATFVHNRSQYPDILSWNLIDATQPDIVIVEVVERLFNKQELDTLLSRLAPQ